MSAESQHESSMPTGEAIGQLYLELKEIARRYLADERPNHTLQATALVHEAYLRLADYQTSELQNRSDYVEIYARTMRRILVDHARRRSAEKRSGAIPHISLQGTTAESADTTLLNIVELDDALNRLSELHARHAKVVELRYFAGMSIEETAAALGVSEWTVKNDWRAARAWLMTQLQPETSSGTSP